MKKLLTTILTVAVMLSLLAAFSVNAFAAEIDGAQDFSTLEGLDDLENITTGVTAEDLNHDDCGAPLWLQFINNIFNYIRSMLGLPERCVCGSRI